MDRAPKLLTPSSQPNPFATRYVVPGNLPWLSVDAERVDAQLVDLAIRFQSNLGRRAAVVGPHGSGKSTLIEHLVPLLGSVVYRSRPGDQAGAAGQPTSEAGGRSFRSELKSTPVVWLGLRRSTGDLTLQQREWQRGGLLVIDGFEQLGYFRRAYVQVATRLRGMGLLVTCHRRVSLPTLLETRVTTDLLASIVRAAAERAGVSPGRPMLTRLLQEDFLQELLARSAGNARECLMQLYDHFDSGSPL